MTDTLQPRTFSTTPVEDRCSDTWYSISWPRDADDESLTVREHHRERTRPYRAPWKWTKHFCEIEPGRVSQ